jgi:hypothetical protein
MWEKPLDSGDVPLRNAQRFSWCFDGSCTGCVYETYIYLKGSKTVYSTYYVIMIIVRKFGLEIISYMFPPPDSFFRINLQTQSQTQKITSFTHFIHSLTIKRQIFFLFLSYCCTVPWRTFILIYMCFVNIFLVVRVFNGTIHCWCGQ